MPRPGLACCRCRCYALGQLGVAWQDDEDCEETYPLSGEAYTHILTQLLVMSWAKTNHFEDGVTICCSEDPNTALNVVCRRMYIYIYF